MGNFLARYASRVVIYNRRAYIRLASGVDVIKNVRVAALCLDNALFG